MGEPSSGSAPEAPKPKAKGRAKAKAKGEPKPKAEGGPKAKAKAGAGGKKRKSMGDGSQQNSQPKRKARKPACDAPLPVAVEKRDEFKKFPVGCV